MILVPKNARVIVQGIAGTIGSFHTKRMLDYGTNIVGGVDPGKKGKKIHGVPVFNHVSEIEADVSVIFVPGPKAAEAIQEAVDAGIETIFINTEGIPLHDLAKIDFCNSRVIGPNSPGLINVGENMLGIFPYEYFKKGKVGIISRSSTLTYEVANVLSRAGLGVSSAVGIGADQIIGSDYFDLIREFAEDPNTEVVVIVGEIGGTKEEELAKVLTDFPKPIYSYVVGKSAPEERQMGHAGAIIAYGRGSYESKIEALSKISIIVEDLYSLPDLIRNPPPEEPEEPEEVKKEEPKKPAKKKSKKPAKKPKKSSKKPSKKPAKKPKKLAKKKPAKKPKKPAKKPKKPAKKPKKPAKKKPAKKKNPKKS